MAIPATTGQLRTSLTDMQIGDYIPCTYVASSGAVGTFSNLGVNSGTEIPLAGSATPNGLFYFLKADRGLLIADRVVQHSISWDTLNNNGYIEGKSFVGGIPFCSSCSATFPAWKLFDKASATTHGWFSGPGIATGNVGIRLFNASVVNNYSLQCVNIANYPQYMPKNWTFEGSNDNNTWTILDTQIGISFNQGQLKTFNISNTTKYLYYKLNITLNNGANQVGFAELDLGFADIIYRSLSGGCAYANADGSASTTDKGLGAFPQNEWDKYIVGSDLGGKITKGDDNVWHWNNTYSLCKETPANGYISPSNRTSSNTQRIMRGCTSANRVDFNTSNSIITSYSFRPVLEYLEPTTKATTLFY